MFTRTGEEVISLLSGFVVDVVDIKSFIFAFVREKLNFFLPSYLSLSNIFVDF